MKYNFCSYFDSNYLYMGLTMYRSLSRVCNNFKLWILCFDEITYKLLARMRLKNAELILLEEFEDENLKKAKKNRSMVEYYWTCTPSLPLYILQKFPELKTITYLDADIFFYSDPLPIFKEFSDNSILLIEHRYARNIEKNIKKRGRYNVQFMIFRNDEIGMNALKWWRERCLEWCYSQTEGSKMADQKYLDDWATQFKKVHILKNKGAGLAPWNIMKYNIKQDGDRIFVDEDKLIFYHFQSFKMYSKNLFSLSILKLSNNHKRIIYLPYITNMVDTIDHVKKFDKMFNKGYFSFALNKPKDTIRMIRSFINGNLFRLK